MRIISIDELEDLPGLFSEIEESIGNGFFVAGYFAYECGYHFENITPEVPLRSSLPLAWFGVYRSPLVFNHQSGTFEGEQPIIPRSSGSKFSLKRCSLKISEPEYNKAIEIVKDYIVAGDTYQVNFTDKYTFEFDGSPTACFAALRENKKWVTAHLSTRRARTFSPFHPSSFLSSPAGQ